MYQLEQLWKEKYRCDSEDVWATCCLRFIVMLILVCVKFRLLDCNDGCSRIWRNFLQLHNIGRMSVNMYRQRRMRRYWLGAEQRRENLLDSQINLHWKNRTYWSYYSLWATSSLSELVWLLLYIPVLFKRIFLCTRRQLFHRNVVQLWWDPNTVKSHFAVSII